MTRTPREIDQAVGLQLQGLRIYAGFELAAAAQSLQLDPTELAAYEAGVTRPVPRMILAMAACYDVPPSRVFGIVSASERL